MQDIPAEDDKSGASKEHFRTKEQKIQADGEDQAKANGAVVDKVRHNQENLAARVQKGAKEGNAPTKGSAVKEEKDKRNKDSYEIIAQKNLFSPKRNPFETIEEEKVEEVFDPDSELMVYGTFILGDYKSALIKTLDSDKQKAKEMALGSMVARYRIKDILQDSIVVEDPKGKTYTLSCARAKKERKDVRTGVMAKPGEPFRPDQTKMADSAPSGIPAPSRPTPLSRKREERAAILSELRKRHLQKEAQQQQMPPGGKEGQIERPASTSQ